MRKIYPCVGRPDLFADAEEYEARSGRKKGQHRVAGIIWRIGSKGKRQISKKPFDAHLQKGGRFSVSFTQKEEILQFWFEIKNSFEPATCQHVNKTSTEWKTLTRYTCKDCGSVWETDSSG